MNNWIHVFTIINGYAFIVLFKAGLDLCNFRYSKMRWSVWFIYVIFIDELLRIIGEIHTAVYDL